MATALLVHGCAAPVLPPPAPVSAPAPVARAGRPGFVVAAPGASQDLATGEMASEIARRTGFGLVVSGVGAEDGPAGQGAQAHERRVLEVARGPLRFYAELHGRERPPCAGAIAIATVGVDRERALRLRTLAELVRDAHLRAQPEVERLPVLVEPADERAGSAATRRDGILRLPREALHIALPRCGRRDFRAAYTAILADFLAQAVLVSAGP